MKAEVNAKALASQKEPKLFLEMKQVFGNLSESEPFVYSFTKNYNNILAQGIKQCVKEINTNALEK